MVQPAPGFADRQHTKVVPFISFSLKAERTLLSLEQGQCQLVPKEKLAEFRDP
jgi:hypothetical protein